MGKFYITTAIDYVNNLPHLGTAYEKIGADCIARYRRLCGDEVFFLMGTDEHSQNVAERASEEGLEPQAFCDGMAVAFEKTWKTLGISYDDFIRTTDRRHVETVQALLTRIHENGDIFKGLYKGFYCVSCESFKGEDDLVDGKCKTHGTKPDWIEEENYFFALSKYEDRLLELVKGTNFVEPETRRKEVLGIIEGGLQDISISRTGVTWGIPLPFDQETRTYVWFDALVNYISGVGFSDDPEAFAKWWPADCHVIGKDIIRFHCVIWPAMLMAAGLPLPKQVHAHGFVFFKGQKMSKSKGVIVSPLEAADLFGADALRYFLLREVSWGKDGDFTWERFVGRFNADLADDLGNLVNRVRSLIARQGGEVGRPEAMEPIDEELRDKAIEVKQRYKEQFDRYEFHQGLATAWELVQLSNRYVDRTAPWKLLKEGGGERLAAVLYNLAEAVRWIAVLICPVMPLKADEIFAGLGLAGGAAQGSLKQWASPDAFVGIEVGKGLFPKIDKKKLKMVMDEGDAVVTEQKMEQKTEKTEKKTEQKTEGEQITIDDFFKVDLRVATILEAEKVEKADRLLRLQVDVGGETRQLVAGIAEHYSPEELVGKSIVVVANLKPAKIRGVESNGMLLAASGADGTVSILQPLKEVEPGSRVK